MTDNEELIERSGSIQQKSKTTNITDILSQVNKKSKSTKNNKNLGTEMLYGVQ